jgi:hypothetical protein
MFNKRTDLILLTIIDKFESVIDSLYLYDFLSGNIENNEFYQRTFIGQEPTLYFDMPPTYGLGKMLKHDTELGQLILKLLADYKQELSAISDIDSNYNIKLIKKTKPYFKMGWTKFHKKYQNCYGIIRFSNIIFNDSNDRAIFYVEKFKGSLNASGDIIVMRKINDKWTIEHYINQWMS